MEGLGIGFVPFSLRGKDFLTGPMNEGTRLGSPDFRNALPRFTPEAMKANQAPVDLLAEVGERQKATPAQVALAWLLAQKPRVAPTPGTAKLRRLEENLRAAAVELRPEGLRDIEMAASRITVHGARWPEQHERWTGWQAGSRGFGFVGCLQFAR